MKQLAAYLTVFGAGLILVAVVGTLWQVGLFAWQVGWPITALLPWGVGLFLAGYVIEQIRSI